MTFTYVDSDYSETGNTVCVGRSKCPIQPLSSRFENCVYVLISQLWHFGIAFNSAVLTNPMARQGMEGMELDILTRSCLAKNGLRQAYYLSELDSCVAELSMLSLRNQKRQGQVRAAAASAWRTVWRWL
jgi:hypothetical protein